MNNELTSLIKDNEKFIYSLINKYSSYFDQEDLYQVAVIGLLKAYKNYKNDKDTKFSSYAYFYMQGEIKKYLRENNAFKISKELLSLNAKLKEAENILSLKLMREPTLEELSLFLEIDYDKIEEVKSSCLFVSSLDSINEEDFDLYSKVAVTEQNYDSAILDLKRELNNLSYEDKVLIEERYINDLTQSAVSNLLNISQVQVSRKEKEILTRLRTKLR